MSTLKVDNLSNLLGTKTIPMGTVVDGAAKAWVNFNGTGTVAIRASFNVSSITDNGTGDYTVNFTSAMPDNAYAWVVNGQRGDGAGMNGAFFAAYATAANAYTSATTTTFRIAVPGQPGNLGVDPLAVTAVFFR